MAAFIAKMRHASLPTHQKEKVVEGSNRDEILHHAWATCDPLYYVERIISQADLVEVWHEGVGWRVGAEQYLSS